MVACMKFVPILLAVPSVLAQLPTSLFARTDIDGFDPDSIPLSCAQNQCQVYAQAFNDPDCTDLSCVCTKPVESSFQSCLQCAHDANVAGLDQSLVDELVSGFASDCSSAGFPISGVSTGNGSSSSGSSSSGSSSSGSSSSDTKSGSSSSGSSSDVDSNDPFGVGVNTNGNGAADLAPMGSFVLVVAVALGALAL